MHGGDANAAFGDHVTCDGAIDAAGDEQHRVSVGADRHTARAKNLVCKDERLLLTNLDPDIEVGRVHVYAKRGKRIQQETAHHAADILRAHRKALVRAAGNHLKARFRNTFHAAGDERLRCLDHRVPIFLHRERGADGMDAEHARELLRGFIHRLRRDTEDEHAPLLTHDLDRQRTEGEGDALHQTALKIGTVETF